MCFSFSEDGPQNKLLPECLRYSVLGGGDDKPIPHQPYVN
jgi:hypothetical protein